MYYRLFLWIILGTCPAVCQECSAHVVIDPFDSVTHKGIDGLQAADFEAKMGDTLLPITSASQTFNSRVLVIVQGTGSSSDRGLLKIVQGVASLASQQPAGRQVAFGIYGERAVFTKGFVTKPEERGTAIDGVLQQLDSLGKSAAVFDALHEGLSLFGQPQPGDAIVLVGDAHDIKSKRNDRDLDKEFAEHRARLLLVVVPSMHMEGLNDNHLRKYEETFALHGLASSTGGAYTRAITPTLVDFAWAGYLLELKLPAGMDKPKNWKLQLRGAAAKAHKDALIYQPYKLAPCGATTASAQ